MGIAVNEQNRHLRRMITPEKVCNKGLHPLHTPGMWYHTRKHHFRHCSWQLFWISEVPNCQKQSINDVFNMYVDWSTCTHNAHIRTQSFAKVLKNIQLSSKSRQKFNIWPNICVNYAYLLYRNGALMTFCEQFYDWRILKSVILYHYKMIQFTKLIFVCIPPENLLSVL